MTFRVWIAASVAVLYTWCFAARRSSAFEGDGPFRFEIEDYALSKFTDKCFDSPGYAVIQAETGSPNDAPLNASEFSTTAKIILAGAILLNKHNDNLDRQCDNDVVT